MINWESLMMRSLQPWLLQAKAAPLIKSAEWRHKANQILWSLMSPVIPGMVFIIHWFDHRINLHKNKAWWITLSHDASGHDHCSLMLTIRWDMMGWEDITSQSEASIAGPDQSEAVTLPWSQFTSVWGPFTDNDLCPVSLLWPAQLSPDSNWFVYLDVDHCVPSLLEISETSDTRRNDHEDNYSRPIVILWWQPSRHQH